MASSTTNLSTAPFNFYLARDSTRYPFHPNYTYESWFKPQKDMVVITGDNNALYLTPFMMNSLGSITNSRLFKDAETKRPKKRHLNQTFEIYSEETVDTIDMLLKAAQGTLPDEQFPWLQIRDCLKYCRKARLDRSVFHAIMEDTIPNLHSYELFPALVYFSRHKHLAGALCVLEQGRRAEASSRGEHVCRPVRPNKEGQEWTREEIRLFPEHWSLAFSAAQRATEVQGFGARTKVYWEIFCLCFEHHLSLPREELRARAEGSHFNSS